LSSEYKSIKRDSRKVYEMMMKKMDKEKLRNGLIHLMKAFGDKDILEAWYQISKSERRCIEKAQNDIYVQIFSEHPITPDQAIQIMEQQCPNSYERLENLNALCQAKFKEQGKQFYKDIEKLPQSVQNISKGLYENLKQWMQSGYDMSQVKQTFVPFLQGLLRLSQEDREKFAESCPDLAPLLIGDLREHAGTIIKAIIRWLQTGDSDFVHTQDVMRAFGKFIPYLKEQCKKLKKMIADAPEQDLPEFVVKCIEEDIDEMIEKIDFGSQGQLDEEDKIPEIASEDLGEIQEIGVVA